MDKSWSEYRDDLWFMITLKRETLLVHTSVLTVNISLCWEQTLWLQCYLGLRSNAVSYKSLNLFWPSCRLTLWFCVPPWASQPLSSCFVALLLLLTVIEHRTEPCSHIAWIISMHMNENHCNFEYSTMQIVNGCIYIKLLSKIFIYVLFRDSHTHTHTHTHTHCKLPYKMLAWP